MRWIEYRDSEFGRQPRPSVYANTGVSYLEARNNSVQLTARKLTGMVETTDANEAVASRE